MNRRIPDGTYGGVGRRGLVTPSYPIGGLRSSIRFLLLGTLSERRGNGHSPR